ncbi:hypothetical protein FOZ63_017386 [Perkinsus olseni]|uniref:Anaphase-promoting complex subunit 1 n=1 Tax=Perkinsus olseni TaxID=32597 RepID=A0A7J6UEK0_PEROL|nr:hypothetical protein FOZ63_017386 [Perkinsus olseni]KAF4755526.1 hypothetical protein FOZ62_017543 [Perkinsus olseni]
MISTEDIGRSPYGTLLASAGDENMAACWGSHAPSVICSSLRCVLCQATSGVAPVEGPFRTATECRGDGSVMRVPSCCEAMQRSGGRLLEERPMRVALAGLCCHHPIVMQIEVKGDQAGDDQLTREEQQFWLGLLILESAASSIGRGAMTFDTQDRPLFNMEEVSTSGRYSSSRATIALSSSTGPSMDWPEFHNGVAFGLAVRPPRGRRPDREWFIRNMRWKRASDDSCFRRAGLLMGLGLHGYMTPDVFRADDWLVEIGMGNCASICAVLLGVGASNIGSRDLKACRLCYLHTPALSGQVDQSTGSSTQTLVQCCGVVALGLLHYKSAHVTLATTLLKNLRDLSSITGGSTECGVGLRPAYGVSLGVAFALAYADKPLPRNLEDELMACTKDIDSSVPAYIALGLLHYGKADSRVLEVLQLPRTRHQLCRRRPNCWFAVAVARTMVQGEVPDLPSFVGGCREKYRATAGESSPFVEAEAALYMEAGCMLGLALSNMGSDDLGVRDRILAALERMLRMESWQEGMPSVTSFGAITSHPPDDCGPDSKTLLTCRLSVLLSAATVMAGSGCPRVSAFIDRVRQKVFESTHTPAAEFEFVYGIHQAQHLATGLLHLGWGRCKLKNNALGRAVVLLALWPGYRHDVSDMNVCMLRDSTRWFDKSDGIYTPQQARTPATEFDHDNRPSIVSILDEPIGCDVAIIGGGISGCSLAWVLVRFTDINSVVVLERHNNVGRVCSHAKNNSQTLHRGDIETNYSIQKARRANAQAELLRRFTTTVLEEPERDSCIFRMSKVCLGVGEEEQELLRQRYESFHEEFPLMRFTEKKEEIFRLEPAVVLEDLDGSSFRSEPLAAIAIEDEYAAVNYGELTHSFVRHSRRHASETGKKVEFITSTKVESLAPSDDGDVMLRCSMNDVEVRARFCIVSAGGYSLLLAHSLGLARHLSLLPIAGSFFFAGSSGAYQRLLNGKVYAVQDPALPFAAPHADPDVAKLGHPTRFGPTAAFHPMMERYLLESLPDALRTMQLTDPATIAALADILAERSHLIGYALAQMTYEAPLLGEHQYAINEAGRLVPAIARGRVRLSPAWGFGGVRPQLLDTRKKTLLMGAGKIIEPEVPNMIFNITPSPGATVCLASALSDALRICDNLGAEFDYDEVMRLLAVNLRDPCVAELVLT